MRLATLTLLAALAATSTPLGAQVELRFSADVHAKPGGPAVALLLPGAMLATGPADGTETLVTFEGWVDASRLGARRDSFPTSVSGRLTLRVRAQASPKGAIIAVLQPGTGLHIVARRGTWTRVRRSGWIATAPLQRSTAESAARGARAGAKAGVSRPAAPPSASSAAPSAAAPAAPSAAAPVASSAGASAPAAKAAPKSRETGVIASSGGRFRDLPKGRVLGGISSGSIVEIMARQFGWVRVRADGWIAERDLVSGEQVAPPDVTAADLRADPLGMKGRVVQWDVEVMSLQIADPLRVELARDEPYLLARGPGEENALLYLAVPAPMLAKARALQPLAKIRITARIRSGRSEPAGTPILDLLSIAKR